MIDIEKLKNEFFKDEVKDQIKAVFSYGSAVYKNKTPDDLDFIVVTDDFSGTHYGFVDSVEVQVTFYDFNRFKAELERHEISMIECMMLPVEDNDLVFYIDEDVKALFDSFHLIRTDLRKAISAKTSNSYVKAKKKILISKDFDIQSSKKSLWHSLRMVMFASDFCENNSLNYEIANDLFIEISDDYDKIDDMELDDFWKMIHTKYKPVQNSLMSRLRKLAPKD